MERIHYTVTFDNQGKASLSYMKTENFTETRMGFSFGLFPSLTFTSIKNPRVDYVVHHADVRYLDNVYGQGQENKYDETVVYKTLTGAKHATESDFVNTGMDWANRAMQGLGNMAMEYRDRGGGAAGFGRIKASKGNGPNSNVSKQATAASSGNRGAANSNKATIPLSSPKFNPAKPALINEQLSMHTGDNKWTRT